MNQFSYGAAGVRRRAQIPWDAAARTRCSAGGFGPTGSQISVLSSATASWGRSMVVLAGRLVPRTGGLILAEGAREEIEAAVASDPFVVDGAATVEIIEFAPTWQR